MKRNSDSANDPKLTFYDLGILQGCMTWNEFWIFASKLNDEAYSKSKKRKLSFSSKHNFGKNISSSRDFDEKFNELEDGAETIFDNILMQRYGGIRVPSAFAGIPKDQQQGFLIETKEPSGVIRRIFIKNGDGQNPCYIGVVPKLGVPMGFTEEEILLPQRCTEINIYNRDYPDKRYLPTISLTGRNGLPLTAPKLFTYGEDRILEVDNLQWASISEWYRMNPTVVVRQIKIGRPEKDIFMSDEELSQMKRDKAGDMKDNDVWK